MGFIIDFTHKLGMQFDSKQSVKEDVNMLKIPGNFTISLCIYYFKKFF